MQFCKDTVSAVALMAYAKQNSNAIAIIKMALTLNDPVTQRDRNSQ